MISTKSSILVGMGEMSVSSDEDTVLTCLGLGSCVGLAVYDSKLKVGGMVHIVLPKFEDGNGGSPPKYADIAVPYLVKEMEKLGASARRLTARIAGGAQMYSTPGHVTVFNTGHRNVEATRAALEAAGVPILGADTGGSHGRTIKLDIATGDVTVATAGSEAKRL
jgi:chemotaxis protein CheD